jgi:FkbM family methyltransferase
MGLDFCILVKTTIIIKKGLTSATGNLYCGLFEYYDMAFLLHFLRPNDLFIDIGANIGWYSLIAAQKIKAENHIYAFEPASNAYQKLLKHISLNEASQISAHNCCIADYEGEILLNICEDDAYNSVGNSPILNIQEQVNSPVINIDAFIEKYRIPKVDIIKIDTEGAEMLVLKGAKKTLQKFSPVIFLKLIKKC